MECENEMLHVGEGAADLQKPDIYRENGKMEEYYKGQFAQKVTVKKPWV